MSRIVGLIAFMCALPCLAVSEVSERVITVTGTAVIQVVPDFVAWNIAIIDTDVSLAAAKKRNDARVVAAMDLIKGLGPEPIDVQTSNVSVYKEYNHDEQGRQTTFKHYVVNRNIAVKQRDLTRFDEFNALVEKTEADVNFSWQSSQAIELRKEARKRAVQIAKEKAEAMLAELDSTLGGPIAVDEEAGETVPFFAQNNAMQLAGPAPTDEISGTTAPGSLEIKVTVRVKFAIAN